MQIQRFTPSTFVPNGLWSGVPEQVYRAHAALSGSELGHLLRSPAHFHAHRNGGFETTPQMVLGSAIHCAVLEPDAFSSRYAVLPGDKRTKAYKDSAACAAEAGLIPISADDKELCDTLRDRIASDPTTKSLLGGLHEVSMFWTDDRAGACKGRLDCLVKNAGTGAEYILVDLKTSANAMPGDFQKSVVNYGYQLQVIHYCAGFHALTGIWPGFAFVVIEKAPPYAIQNYVVSDEFMSIASNEHDGVLETYSRCMLTDIWPAPPTDLQRLDLPEWHVRKVL